MTRHEHGQLQDAIFELHEGYAFRAIRILEEIARVAQEQFALEDEFWNEAEADSVPVNREAA
jgi:hypothetical protein